jgi:hypothetical protein
MTVRRPRPFALALALVALVLASAAGRGAAAQDDTPEPGPPLVYHQLTNRVSASNSVGYPVLSADGSTAVFADAPASGDPANPNRIYVVPADGGTPTEVDAYVPRCFCGAHVDLSADGGTVVTTDSMQVRIADGGAARELLVLGSNEITAIRITGDGQTVFFLVRRDVTTADGTTRLDRGVWAIEADGSDLRLVLGAADVAEVVGVPI